MRVFAPLFAVLVLFFPAGAGQAASQFVFPNPSGPFAVGFKAVHQYDHARAYRSDVDAATGKRYEGEQARPVQTLVWYPAGAPGKPMVYSDYLRLIGSEDDFGRTEAQAGALADRFVRDGYLAVSGLEQGQAALRDPMRAQRDAGTAPGSFPVVIYAPSISAPAAENADLCEYLASHGYIVIASPSLGTRGREMASDLEGAETHAADIAFLVRYAHTLPHADPKRLALAGYSWGGLANVLAAAKDRRIKALVDLDGSVRAYPELVAAAKYLSPTSLRVPMLFAGGRPASMEALAQRGKPASGFLNDVKHADLYKLTMYPMQHFAFSSTYLRFAPESMFNQYPRAEVNRAHGWVADYVRHFLDAYLKDDGAARAWLAATPASHGMPAYAVTLEARPAAPAPPTRTELAAELARRGFEHAHAAYEALRERDKNFILPEPELNEWGYGLLRAGQPRQAVQIFRLATLLHPDSANAFDSLADGLEQAGDKAGAIAHYRRSLKLNPGNRNAEARLQMLGAARQAGKPAANRAGVR
ncbi:dienelactone hydrolase family protein [Massilia sp. SYSU DXS3249]